MDYVKNLIDSELKYFDEQKLDEDEWRDTEMRDYDSGRISAFLDLADLIKYRSKELFELSSYIQSNIIREG